MANRNKNGNGSNKGDDRNGGEPMPEPTRGRRITADDLTKAAEAAREAAQAASNAAEAVVVALESGQIDEGLIGMEEGRGGGTLSSQDHGGQGGQQGGMVAFEEFMAQLAGVLKKAGDNVNVTEHARWVKIESRKNGHKIYVAKGKNQVNRIESTLPADLVPGSSEPDRKNGRIASYIPADPKAVATAIRALVQMDEQIRAPQRGGGQGGGQQQGGGGGAGSGGGGRQGPQYN